MIVKVSRHVFGSLQGYRTLAASDDLTPAEVGELESFVFGQTNDPNYLASLADTPAYWSRPLASGRRAITRVLPGPADEQGRQSLRFVTAVLHTNDWVAALNGEDAALLRVDSIWSWNGQPRLPREEIRVAKPPRVNPTPEQRTRILSLLGLIETLSDSSTTTIVVEPRDLTADELNMVVALLPLWYRPQFSYGLRSLSEGLPVLVNSLAPGASRGKSRRKIVRWLPTSGLVSGKYASGLAHFWPPGEAPPWEFVNNCRAFGRLLPTWDGTESPAGTVAIAGQMPEFTRSRSPGLRIPAFAYWVLIVVVTMAATALVVIRTTQARRQADAVLTAAETFLATNADPSQLPVAGSARQDLIREAETLAEQVTALRASTRAERQNDVKGRLVSWLARAGARAQEYGSLDELLVGFGTFAAPLGLDAPASLSKIPDASARAAVRGWKMRLHEARDEAEDIGDPYPGRIVAALNRIAQWERHVQDLVEHCRAGLERLDQAFSASLPTHLDNQMVASCARDTKELAQIAEILPQAVNTPNEPADVDTVDEVLAGLQAARERIQRLADSWNARIEELRGDYERFAERAKGFIDQHNLDIDPVRAEDLTEPWKGAQDAGAALGQALAKWPDAPDALARRDTINNWLDKASQLAISHFDKELSHAGTIWEAEKKRARNASTNGAAEELPNPGPAKDALERALDYWNKNAEMIRYFDQAFADSVHVQATILHGKLLAAEDKYKAALQSTATGGPKP